jgi:hypothetical protein
MDQLKSDECKYLRDELAANRKFVFERPLLIVTATLTAALTIEDTEILGGLALPFLMVLAFNLWFTFNRLESSARIVGYIQLVHEGESKFRWVGWETALRAYRSWLFNLKQGTAISPSDDHQVRRYDSMAYYGPIFYFHVCLGVLVTLVLVGRAGVRRELISAVGGSPSWAILNFNAALLFIFGLYALRFRPHKVTHLIEWKRQVWEIVLERETRNDLGESNLPGPLGSGRTGPSLSSR